MEKVNAIHHEKKSENIKAIVGRGIKSSLGPRRIRSLESASIR